MQNKKRIFVGIVICGAAYYGARWIYYYIYPGVDNKKDKTKQISQGTSNGSLNFYSNESVRPYSFDTATTTSITSRCTTRTSYMFHDTEPNMHLLTIYQEQLAIVDTVPVPRSDRADQMLCESREEFLAKISCLRKAFESLVHSSENRSFFIHGGKDIISMFLSHSASDLEKCLEAYDKLLKYVGDLNNHEDIKAELATRNIPVLSFYDLVVDYIILESLDDLEKPPPFVSSIVSNTWVSVNFRKSACQSAVATALKYKRSQLKRPNGFFAHFYSLLDYLSPALAWGFLGSDEDLKIKCGLLKECLLGLARDYFSFDRVLFTSFQELQDDIMTVTRERYYDLTDRLSL